MASLHTVGPGQQIARHVAHNMSIMARIYVELFVKHAQINALTAKFNKNHWMITSPISTMNANQYSTVCIFVETFHDLG